MNSPAETVAPSNRSRKRKQSWLRTLIKWHNEQAGFNHQVLNDPDLRFTERQQILKAREYHQRTAALLRELQQ